MRLIIDSQTMFIWIFQYQRNSSLQSCSIFNTKDYVRGQMNVLFVTFIQFERRTHYSEKNPLQTVSNKEEIMYLMVKYLKLS